MINLHLTRYLKGSRRGPGALQANALLHQEPYFSVYYCLFWFFILVFVGPILGMVLPWKCLYELICYFVMKDRFVKPKQSKEDGTKVQLAVVITGCDSGIGRELAIHLATEGFQVFAGCLQEESLEDLNKMGMSIKPHKVDVTKDEDVQSWQATVSNWLEDGEKVKEQRILHSVFNNAGIGEPGYMDWLPMSAYERCMDVNFYGILRVTKAFLPLLKSQAISEKYRQAQIINVTSVAGFASGLGIAASAYEASKHAAESFTNSLRVELVPFGIRVVTINPSFFTTPLTTNVGQKMADYFDTHVPKDIRNEYGEEFIQNYLDQCENTFNAAQWDLVVLIESLVRVVKSKDPPFQWLIGLDSSFFMAFSMLPPWARQVMVQLGLPPQTPAILSKTKK